MNFHASFIEFGITVCYILIFGFLVRSYMAKYPDSSLSKALAFIY